MKKMGIGCESTYPRMFLSTAQAQLSETTTEMRLAL